MKTPLDELRASVVPLYVYTGHRIRHIKTNSTYRVTGFVFLETTMEIHFTYCPLIEPSVVFCRPVSELLDGRFEVEE